MKAYISKVVYDNITPEGRDAMGSQDQFISNEYQSISNMKRYAFKHCSPGKYHIKAYYDFENKCYGEPDIDTYHTVS